MGTEFLKVSFYLCGNLLKVTGIDSEAALRSFTAGASALKTNVPGTVYGDESGTDTDGTDPLAFSLPDEDLLTGATEDVYGADGNGTDSLLTPEARLAALAAGPQVLESNEWSASNRLIQNTNTFGDVTTYQYDGDGNRVSMRTTVGDDTIPNAYPSSNPAGTRDGWESQYKKRQLDIYFTNDITLSNPQPLMATGDTGQSWKQSYVYGAGEERISMTYRVSGDASNDWEPTEGASGAHADGTTKTLYYLSDALGSVIGLEGQDGSVSARYRYDEFGVAENPEKFDLNWSGPDNLFGYTSLGYDYYSGYSHAQARDFDSSVGRFISEDTYEGEMEDPLSLNLYTYVSNNPLTYVDPSGHRKEWEPYEVQELRWLLNDARAKNYSKSNKYFKATKEGIWNRYNFASFMKRNQYNYLYGLLTGTSAYKNSAGNADWAREQLISAFFESKEAEYIANLGLLMVGGMAARNSGPRNSPSEMGNRNTARGAGNAFQWTGKNFSQMGKNMSPNEMISNLEKSGWTKTVEAGGKKSGPATILTDPSTGTKVRIHAEPGEGTPYFRVQNKGGGYLDDNGVFPSNATKQELRDSTHFYFEK